jgi:hypothetical protein
MGISSIQYSFLIQQAKVTKEKKFRSFMFCRAGCSPWRAVGFSSLEVLFLEEIKGKKKLINIFCNSGSSSYIIHSYLRNRQVRLWLSEHLLPKFQNIRFNAIVKLIETEKVKPVVN